jgi:hypothetical protein
MQGAPFLQMKTEVTDTLQHTPHRTEEKFSPNCLKQKTLNTLK